MTTLSHLCRYVFIALLLHFCIYFYLFIRYTYCCFSLFSTVSNSCQMFSPMYITNFLWITPFFTWPPILKLCQLDVNMTLIRLQYDTFSSDICTHISVKQRCVISLLLFFLSMKNWSKRKLKDNIITIFDILSLW